MTTTWGGVAVPAPAGSGSDDDPGSRGGGAGVTGSLCHPSCSLGRRAPSTPDESRPGGSGASDRPSGPEWLAAAEGPAACTCSTTRVRTSGSVCGQDSVAQVEDVPATAAPGGREDLLDPRGRRRPPEPARTAGSRLPCSATPGRTRPAAASRGTRKSTPITSAPALDIVSEQLAGAHPEEDPRDPVRRRPDPRSPPRAVRDVRQDELLVVRCREGPRPRVEQLDRARPGQHLHPQEGCPRSGRAGRRGRARAPGSDSISALVRAWSRLGPPSIR